MLAPFSTKVPLPVAVRPPDPAITPLTVKVLLAAAESVVSAVTLTLRFVTRVTLSVATKPPPARVRLVAAEAGTAPRAAALAIESEPPLMVVPPV